MTASRSEPASQLRPMHPPFTHFPIAAYVLAAAFDIISLAGGSGHKWSAQLWHAGTFVLVAGLGVCLLTMLTGFWDLIRFPEHRQEAIKAIAVHVCVQAAVFMIGAGDVAWRLTERNQPSTPPGILVLTVAAAVLVCVGGHVGGTLVFKYGTGVARSALAGTAELAAGPAPSHGHAAPARHRSQSS